MKEYYIFFEDKQAAEAAYKAIVIFLKKKYKDMKLEKNFKLNGKSTILIKPSSGVYERYHFVTCYDRYKKFITKESILTYPEAFSQILITEDLKE